MVTEYAVLWDRSGAYLAQAVNDAIKKRWQPLGGVAGSTLWLRGSERNIPEDQMLYQAVVRTDYS